MITENKTNIKTSGQHEHYLCVIMPAYNEGIKLEANLLSASKAIGKFVDSYQIIVVNDGSKDETEHAAKKAAQADSHIIYSGYEQNMGKGYAICHGVNIADASYIAFLDSDLELDPRMLRYFLKALETTDADIAIGSKLHKGSKLKYPLSRKIISIGYYFILKLLFNLNIKDTQTGIKLFKAPLIKALCKSLTTYGFAFDIEILATASKQGYKITELPICLHYNRDKRSKSKVSLKQIFQVFNDTLAIKKLLKKKDFPQ